MGWRQLSSQSPPILFGHTNTGTCTPTHTECVIQRTAIKQCTKPLSTLSSPVDFSIFKIAPNGNQTFSCVPLWILEDLKTYIKRSANRKAATNRRKVVLGDQCCHVIMKDDRTSKVQSGPLRVAVVGASEVGKSALTVRYLTKRFIGEYRSDSGELQYPTSVLVFLP